ncbi:MAG TPA: Gfo/Idh/MocA family oxidoreductase [Rhodothermales bacterium]|nr:Gfo/Idh/MocA family oxidoreductase [Rhodothermales bacterium]
MPLSDSPVRFAILGTGMVARYHREAILANRDRGAELAAVVHHDPDRFESIGREFGAPCISEEEMLERPDIDVVCICTPSGQHAEQTVAAAEAGKHILVEKPIALSLEDADRMIAACRNAGVKLGVVFQRRAEPLFRRVHDAIEAGDLGSLTLGVVTLPYFRGQPYYDSAEWRGTWELDGGGVLMNQGIHIIDLLLWYMGDPVEINAFAATLHREIEVEDVAAASLQFTSGSVATIAATTTAEPGFSHRIEIYGTGGGIQVEGEAVTRWVLARPESAQVEPYEATSPADAGAGGDPRGIAATGHTRIVTDFIQAVREDRPPMADGQEGRRSLAAILSIYEAAGLRTLS